MSIEARLERLKRLMQFYKRLVVILALVIVAGVSMGQTSDYGDIVCSNLKVVDETGGAAVTLEVSKRGGLVYV
jgi:hypothetical protein